jgi:hypothetical protein
LVERESSNSRWESTITENTDAEIRHVNGWHETILGRDLDGHAEDAILETPLILMTPDRSEGVLMAMPKSRRSSKPGFASAKTTLADGIEQGCFSPTADN